MWSVDFGEIEHLQHRGAGDDLAEEMKDTFVPLKAEIVCWARVVKDNRIV